MYRFAVVVAISVLSFTASAFAERVGPATSVQAVGEKPMPPAPRLAEQRALAPAVTLAPAREVEPEKIDAIHEWNRSGRTPARNGFSRALGDPIEVSFTKAKASKIASQSIARGVMVAGDRSMIWSGLVEVRGAGRVRLHLEDVKLPVGTTLWIYGGGEVRSFGLELMDKQHTIWTPSIGSERIYLEVEVPTSDAEASFRVRELMELLVPETTSAMQQHGRTPAPEDSSSCLIDATCTTSYANAMKAMAQLQFIENGDGFVCSGGLLNDKDATTFIPYLLTANHCFDNDSAAISLEAFWDYKTATCSGSFPSFSSLQRSNGSALLATSANSDFTLVRLASIPANRYFMGWDTAAVANGTTLHRLSFPFPDEYNVPLPERYSDTLLNTSFTACSSKPRPQFLYSTGGQGGTYGGSSGSPVFSDGDYVRGQLFGRCGFDPSLGCNTSIASVDGAFSQTYPSIQQFINASGGDTCTPDSETACMLSNRFKVKIRVRNNFASPPVDFQAKVNTAASLSVPKFETTFWYFSTNTNIEFMVKILDQGRADGKIDFLSGVATPFENWIDVTDTKTGQLKTYHTNLGAQTGTTEFGAFPP